jgi:hypothetical protein
MERENVSVRERDKGGDVYDYICFCVLKVFLKINFFLINFFIFSKYINIKNNF